MPCAGGLNDPKFMIPVRTDNIAFDEAPPEFIRGNIINGHPNWHDCLAELFEALNEAGVPRQPLPDDGALQTLVAAREEGRRFIQPPSGGRADELVSHRGAQTHLLLPV